MNTNTPHNHTKISQGCYAADHGGHEVVLVDVKMPYRGRTTGVGHGKPGKAMAGDRLVWCAALLEEYWDGAIAHPRNASVGMSGPDCRGQCDADPHPGTRRSIFEVSFICRGAGKPW